MQPRHCTAGSSTCLGRGGGVDSAGGSGDGGGGSQGRLEQRRGVQGGAQHSSLVRPQRDLRLGLVKVRLKMQRQPRKRLRAPGGCGPARSTP